MGPAAAAAGSVGAAADAAEPAAVAPGEGRTAREGGCRPVLRVMACCVQAAAVSSAWASGLHVLACLAAAEGQAWGASQASAWPHRPVVLQAWTNSFTDA
jgi:hypothetical protein